MQGVDERKGGIRWVNWEVEMLRGKVLESLKVWEDIYGALHPSGQQDLECCE